ncbi:hypothetical protein HDE_09566 [Halotydeus destructor]|nr:hypothetical protein HDE_09566 [Halotydeus destructor]
MSGLSLRIHSHVGIRHEVKQDVLDSMEGIPFEVLAYLVISVHLVAGLIHGSFRLSARQYLEAIWNSCRCFLSQENSTLKPHSGRFLWLCFNVMVFVTVVGYILNVMSTDGFVIKQSRRVETLDDVYDEYFSNMKFYLPKNDFFYNFATRATPTSKMGQLYAFMNKTNDCSHVKTCSFFEGLFGSANQQEIRKVVEESARVGGAAIFLTGEFSDGLLVPLLCRSSEPELAEKMYRAPQAVAGDLLVTFTRDDMDAQVMQFLKFKCSSFFEFDLLWKYFDQVIERIFSIYKWPDKNLAYYTCVRGDLTESRDVTIQVSLAAYKSLFHLLGRAALFGILFLAAEALLDAKKRRWRCMKNSRNRTDKDDNSASSKRTEVSVTKMNHRWRSVGACVIQNSRNSQTRIHRNFRLNSEILRT